GAAGSDFCTGGQGADGACSRHRGAAGPPCRFAADCFFADRYRRQGNARGEFGICGGRRIVNGKLTGRGILLWLGGFFGIVIAVKAGFIWASIATYRGEDEQKPYLQGIEYNHTLERRAEQARLGWTSHIAAQRLPSGAIQVTVMLKDASGAPQT